MNPRSRITYAEMLNTLEELERRDGIPAMTDSEAEADLEATMRTLKIPDPNDLICPSHDWAKEDWQTQVQGSEWMARETVKTEERVQAVRAKYVAQHAERAHKESEQREKKLEAARMRKEYNCKRQGQKKGKSAALQNAVGWCEEKPAAEGFPRFLEMPQNAMSCFMNVALNVSPEELVPYHYVKGKMIKHPDGCHHGIRVKPQMEVLVALCATHHRRGRKVLDDARNVL